MQGKILAHKEEQSISKAFHESGCQEVATCRYDASKDLGSSCSGDMAPTERLKLRRQMAAAAGKHGTTSLSLFMEAYGLEVEEELSSMATQYWAEGVWTGKWHHEQKEAWMRQIQEVQMWRRVRGLAVAVVCETRDLAIKWPHWHTLMFSDETRIDMRFVCPRDVKKKLVQRVRSVCWKKWAASQNSHAPFEEEQGHFEVEGQMWSARDRLVIAKTKQYLEKSERKRWKLKSWNLSWAQTKRM